MAASGHLVVAPEQSCATWRLASADVERSNVGLMSQDFYLLGHTWSLHVYPDTSCGTAAAGTAPCSVLVQSKERGSVNATVTLNGVAQSFNHDFGSGLRNLLTWPGTSSSDSAKTQLEVVLHISSVGEEAMMRAVGEISLVQQLEALKHESSELKSRVATLCDELGIVQKDFNVTNVGCNVAVAIGKKFAAVAVDEHEAASQLSVVQAELMAQKNENGHLVSEQNKLQEELRDVRDDYEILMQRFANAQELKAKSELVAHYAETQLAAERAGVQAKVDAERAGVQAKVDGELGEQAALQAKLDAVKAEKAALVEEQIKMRSEFSNWFSEKQKLEEQVAKLQTERDTEAANAKKAKLQHDVWFYRHKEKEDELKKLKEDQEKKNKKGFFK